MTLIDIRRPDRPLNGKPATMPPWKHPAIKAGRSLYAGSVRGANEPNRKGGYDALKPGGNNKKIGDTILTGRWAGMPIYLLTLEERATCPASCQQWRSCYGNKMEWADRLRPGPELESRLEREIEVLDVEHRNGFVVRTHVLGDFYSVEYVELWRRLLRQYPTLHVWGYSARHDRGDPIAAALARVADEFGWGRFAVRLSNAPTETRSTIVVECPQHKPADATLCGQEMDRKANCASCALCWESEKRICFVKH